MFQTFSVFSRHFKIKSKVVSIDNPVFRLHYRMTSIFLFGCSILVCGTQYFGDHIQCIADSGVSLKVINTYCFIMSTFTVVRHHENFNLSRLTAAHPGVGPHVAEDAEDTIVHHAYYQWVPFILFGQGLLFYAPHYFWKRVEGGRIKALVEGFEYSALSSESVNEMQTDSGIIPSKSKRDSRISQVKTVFLERLHINRPWALSFVFFEILNAVNVVLQIWFLHIFLGGNFWTFGPDVLTSDVNLLDFVFPKVTKCTFHKYGPTGTIQNHDALCVLALNIVNEKIYVFLWFWLFFLAGITFLALIWRSLTVILHSRSVSFNKMMFRIANTNIRDVWTLVTVTKRCYFSDWLFLYYLAKNMDGFVFRDLFISLAEEMERSGSRISDLNENAGLETMPLKK